MTGIDRKGIKNHSLSVLSGTEVERIHEAALGVLAKTGIVIQDDQTLSRLDEAGCRVNYKDLCAWIPSEVIESAVAKAPAVVNLYDRLGKTAMALGSGLFYARTSSGATGVLDMESGQRREPVSQDLVDSVRLADALPHVHGVSTLAVQPLDVSVNSIDVHSVKMALTNTIKPVGYVCLNKELIESVLNMAAIVVGGKETLQERPIITALAESTSPLRLLSSQAAVLQAFASWGVPLTLHAHPIAGFTSPMTLAGELVITHAEILAQATIAELIRPGTPVIYGMSSSVPNMATGVNLAGAVEIGLLGAAVSLLSKRINLPSVMSTGTDAHHPDAQSGMERVFTLLPPALAGIDLVNITTLSTKLTWSLEQLVIDETILNIVERALQGIEVNEDTLALDLINQIGPGGNYLTTNHTLKHFRREIITPDLICRDSLSSWKAAGAPDMRTQAQKKARRILAEHSPEALPENVAIQLDDIVKQVDPG